MKFNEGPDLAGQDGFARASGIRSPRSRAAFALLLAALLSLPVAAGGWLLRDKADVWLLVLGGLMAVLGLFLLFGGARRRGSSSSAGR